VGPAPHPAGADDDAGDAQQGVHVLGLDASQGRRGQVAPQEDLDGRGGDVGEVGGSGKDLARGGGGTWIVGSVSSCGIIGLPVLGGTLLCRLRCIAVLLPPGHLPLHVEKQRLERVHSRQFQAGQYASGLAEEQSQQGRVVLPYVGNVHLEAGVGVGAGRGEVGGGGVGIGLVSGRTAVHPQEAVAVQVAAGLAVVACDDES